MDTRKKNTQVKRVPRTIEEFAQFLHWAGPPDIPAEQAPLRYIAVMWYHGLITIEEGKLIEEGRMLS